MADNKTGGGIKDWADKYKVIREVLNAGSPEEIVKAVYKVDFLTEAQQLIADRIRKWGKSRPGSADSRTFVQKLLAALGVQSKFTFAMFLNSTVDDFKNSLPESNRQIAEGVLAWAKSKPSSPPPAGDDEHRNLPSSLSGRFINLLVHHTKVNRRESIATAIEGGRVNQRHYYLTSDAAETWHGVVFSYSYPTYEHCRSSLQDLMEHEDWIAAVSESTPSTVVMLGGGGAPSKDAVIMKELLRHECLADKNIDYFVVDISEPMLYMSIDWFLKVRPVMQGGDRIKATWVNADFLELADGREMYRKSGSSIIFAITGGTIGNVSEQAFFNSLASVSEPGDLLILSAETLDGTEPDDLNHILRKYDHGDVQRFVKPAVRAAMEKYNLPGPIESVMKLVTTKPLSGFPSLSDVVRSVSVTMSLDIAGRELTLLSSTRYYSDELKAFAAKFGWRFICAVSSHRNPHFCQFLFRRNAVETGGFVAIRQ